MTYGWHSGLSCKASAADAAAEQCAARFAGSSMSSFSTPTFGSFVQCTQVTTQPSCISNPPSGSRCTFNASMTFFGADSAVPTVTRTTSQSLFACELQETPGLTPSKVADYTQLWGQLVLAVVVVLCARAIYNRFTINHGER